jgi:hypothetical protein
VSLARRNLVVGRAGGSPADGRASTAPTLRSLAEHIPAARLVELPGSDYLYFVGDSEALLDEIQEFLTGVREAPEPDRVLATVMFTDIVGSTEQAASLGDRAWRDLVERHHATVRHQLRPGGRHCRRRVLRRVRRPRACDSLRRGDPGRGPRARDRRADRAPHGGVRPVRGQDQRHRGEYQARIGSEAGPGEILASRTVVDLVAGSDIEFADRGMHALKGVPGEWQLFAVVS